MTQVESKTIPTACPSGWAGLKSSSSTFGECYMSFVPREILLSVHLLSGVELLVGPKEGVLVAQLIN